MNTVLVDFMYVLCTFLIKCLKKYHLNVVYMIGNVKKCTHETMFMSFGWRYIYIYLSLFLMIFICLILFNLIKIE